jgi:hypothetical protein
MGGVESPASVGFAHARPTELLSDFTLSEDFAGLR